MGSWRPLAITMLADEPAMGDDIHLVLIVVGVPLAEETRLGTALADR